MRDRVRVISKETVYDGYFRIDRYRLCHESFAGGWTPEVTRELFERGHTVGVLPYDAVRDRVVLIEQFRVGAYAAGWEPWLNEIVAGIIDDGESPEHVARRETKEETGLQIGRLLPITRYLVSPGGTSESVVLFCGEVDSTAAGGIHGLDDEAEDIRVQVLDAADAVAMAGDGRMVNAAGVVALQWFAMNRERVRDAWAAGAPA
ncbi:MAG: NUDIX domain-containing protein [Acetobacterales bacterium]